MFNSSNKFAGSKKKKKATKAVGKPLESFFVVSLREQRHRVPGYFKLR